MKWTDEQQQVIDARHCNLLVSAAAGSGKTAVLVERILQMISDRDNPMNIDELLVVTFTKAAAAQMRDKITAALENMLSKEPDNEHFMRQLNYIHKANILTIDSFCYQVVKEHFHLLGIDPGIRVGEAGEIALLRDEVLQQVIEEFYEKRPDFVEFSDAFSADKQDAGIEAYITKIYELSSSYPRPEEWINQARKELFAEDETEFMELPFMKAYMQEIRSRALEMKDTVVKVLERARGIDGVPYMEKALCADIALLDDMIAADTYTRWSELSGIKFANIGRPGKTEYNPDTALWIKKQRDEYKAAVEELRKGFKLPFDTVLSQMKKQRAMLSAFLDIADEFRRCFLQAKMKKNILEFSDIEHFALQVLCSGYDGDGNPVPSEAAAELSDGFREILIDEYQDSNYLQEDILRCVSKISKGEYNIFMVGDVKQSIYGFRMARPDLFMDKYHAYPMEAGHSCRKILLKNNFRSRANVLETINYIFYQIMGKELGGIDYTENEELVPGKDFPPMEDGSNEGETDCVELLLGESKDFVFLNAGDEGVISEKQETLDENLEDIGRMELEASVVAGRINRLLGREGGKPYQVTDSETGRLRNVEFKDIVILFRAPKAFQQIFSEVLMDRGIPAKVQNENGYFDTVEIRLLLSLLQVADNPYNDVELAAALRGFFGKMNNEELAMLALLQGRMQEKRGHLYRVVERLAAYGGEQEEGGALDMDKLIEEAFALGPSNSREYILQTLCPKCRQFVAIIEDIQERKAYTGLGQLLSDIYYRMGYYYYVEAMPEGGQRIKNLDLFLAETKRFEQGAFKTLFDYLRFVEKLREKSVSLGDAPAQESNEDVVRIMSIHKSKGLEFPVVFLSGIGKGFNLMDTKTPLIIHSDYHLAAKYVDTDRRCGNDTLRRQAVASLMTSESIAEELRILYVGLTRAKEKLIMTGVTPDIPKLIERYKEVAERKEQKLSYSIVRSAGSYLDFITAAFMRNRNFHEAMGKVRKRMDKKGETILSADYELSFALDTPNIRLHTEVYDFKSMAVTHVRSLAEKQMDKMGQLELLRQAPAAGKAEIEKGLLWTYEDDRLTRQKSKLSVTEIKRIYETDYEPSDVVARQTQLQDKYVPDEPCFISGKQPFNAAQKGTWMHKAMELFDNAGAVTRQEIEAHLDRLWQEGFLPEETKEFVTADKVFSFANSALGQRMGNAAREGLLYKEKKFVIGVPLGRLFPDWEGKEQTPVVVQGIIDAYFREGDALVLVDYKTDRVRQGQEKMLANRYETQLKYYKDTLEQLTGLTVAETYIYSFALDREIPVPV